MVVSVKLHTKYICSSSVFWLVHLYQNIFSQLKYFLFRFTTSDTDSWFKTRELQHGDLKKQMETLQKDIVNMKKQKMTLFVSTTAFRRNLLDLLGKKNNANWNLFFSTIICPVILISLSFHNKVHGSMGIWANITVLLPIFLQCARSLYMALWHTKVLKSIDIFVQKLL